MASLKDMLAELDPDVRDRVTKTLQAGAILQEMLADPVAAKELNKLSDQVAKKKNPAHQTADDIAKPYVDAVLAAVEAKFAERDKKSQEDSAVNALADKITHYKTKEDFTDDGIKAVLALMQSKGIADFDIAAREYRRENPPPQPRMNERMAWNFDQSIRAGNEKPFFFPEGDGVPTITENPEAWEREQALRYLSGEIALP